MDREKGYEALAAQKRELTEKGNYTTRADAYIKAHGNNKKVEYRVIVEQWKESQNPKIVILGSRIVAWAIHSNDNGNLNFNFSIFKVAKKDYVNVKWAKGTAIEHALEKLFANPIELGFNDEKVGQAIQANLGKYVSEMDHSTLKTFTRVDKTNLHVVLREISRLGRKTLETTSVKLVADISMEPIWNRIISRDTKTMYHLQMGLRKKALAIMAKGTRDRCEIACAVEILKPSTPKFEQVGTGPLVKNFSFIANKH